MPLGTVLDLRRTAAAGVRGDHPFYPIGRIIGFVPTSPPALGLISGHTMLVPDLSAEPRWQGPDPDQAARILAYGVHSLLSVPLHARGAVLGMANFWRAENPEPFDEDDLTFAEELVARAAVCVDNARRYTREHEMAVTLQRSLLPAACPSRTLSTSPTAICRLRRGWAATGSTSFRCPVRASPWSSVTSSDTDCTPPRRWAACAPRSTISRRWTCPADELLARVDELVARIDQEEPADGDRAEVTGATCLYAVYDPVAAPAPLPGPAIPVPSWCCPTARCGSPTSPPACLWA